MAIATPQRWRFVFGAMINQSLRHYFWADSKIFHHTSLPRRKSTRCFIVFHDQLDATMVKRHDSPHHKCIKDIKICMKTRPGHIGAPILKPRLKRGCVVKIFKPMPHCMSIQDVLTNGPPKQRLTPRWAWTKEMRCNTRNISRFWLEGSIINFMYLSGVYCRKIQGWRERIRMMTYYLTDTLR